MIEFIEKEPWYDDSLFTGGCYMYPNFMVKDGKELFMFNRRFPQAGHENAEDEARKRQLLSTDGKYFKFHSYKDDPLELLKIAAERHLSFCDPKDLWWSDCDKNGYMDFRGNFREVSAAFYYRIYDAELIARIHTAVEHLIRKEWNRV